MKPRTAEMMKTTAQRHLLMPETALAQVDQTLLRSSRSHTPGMARRMDVQDLVDAGPECGRRWNNDRRDPSGTEHLRVLVHSVECVLKVDHVRRELLGHLLQAGTGVNL